MDTNEWEHPEPGWYCRKDNRGSVTWLNHGRWEVIAWLDDTRRKYLPDAKTAKAGMRAVDEYFEVTHGGEKETKEEL
jgi:hypothetical protein